jgi:phosphoribosylglycinamide formyltransferase-1
MFPPLRLAVLLSGSGRTLQNLIDQESDPDWPAKVVLVIANRPEAFGIERARTAGIPTAVVARHEFPGPAFSDEIFSHCRAARADLVCLAGFLQLVQIPDDFAGRVINIHPALLPDFGGQGMYGIHVHRAVLDAGRSDSGCTVHFCTNEYDRGPIIIQKQVPVLPGDTPETLADRVFAAEKVAFPEAIRLLAKSRQPVRYPSGTSCR